MYDIFFRFEKKLLNKWLVYYKNCSSCFHGTTTDTGYQLLKSQSRYILRGYKFLVKNFLIKELTQGGFSFSSSTDAISNGIVLESY